MDGRTLILPIVLLLLIGTFQTSLNASQLGTLSSLRTACSQSTHLCAASYDSVTTHEGDLIINGTQTFVIENCTYIEMGNIFVVDSAKLTLRNVELRINETYFRQFTFEARDNANLEFENVTILSDHLIAVECKGFSVVKVDRCVLSWPGMQGGGLWIQDYCKVLVQNSTISGLIFISWLPTENYHVQVADSEVEDVEIMFPHEATINVNNLRQGFFEYLDMGQKISGNYQTFLELNRTFVNMWRLSSFWDSPTLISNSEIWFGIMIPPGVSVQIDGLGPGFYENKQIGKIELNRTTVITSVDIKMASGEDSSLTLTNSVVQLHVGFNSNLTVIDSVVEEFDTSNSFVGSVVFDNTTWTGILMASFSSFFIGGNVSFRNSGNIEFHSCNITRDYDITLEDIKGGLVPDVNLTLRSEEGTLIWNGTTDSLGQANFNLTFTDSNYTDTLRLEAVKGNLSATANVSFLSDTPVTLTLRAHAVAPTELVAYKTIVGQGDVLPVNVTIVNQGDFAESVSVTLYTNTSAIQTKLVGLANGTSAFLTFSWNTSGFDTGNYTLSAYAEILPNETNVADNMFIGGIIRVSIAGDVNGDWKVDMKDVSYVARRFMCTPSDPLWDSIADLNSDGKIDMKDISLVARHFGEHYP